MTCADSHPLSELSSLGTAGPSGCVFGSVARGDAGPHSDIDLLVEFRPGANLLDLATIELRTLVRAIITGTRSLTADPTTPPVREVAPVGGWASVPVILG